MTLTTLHRVLIVHRELRNTVNQPMYKGAQWRFRANLRARRRVAGTSAGSGFAAASAACAAFTAANATS